MRRTSHPYRHATKSFVLVAHANSRRERRFERALFFYFLFLFFLNFSQLSRARLSHIQTLPSTARARATRSPTSMSSSNPYRPSRALVNASPRSTSESESEASASRARANRVPLERDDRTRVLPRLGFSHEFVDDDRFVERVMPMRNSSSMNASSTKTRASGEWKDGRDARGNRGEDAAARASADERRRARRRWRAEFDRVATQTFGISSEDAMSIEMRARRRDEGLVSAKRDGARASERRERDLESLKEKFKRTVRERDEARERVESLRRESARAEEEMENARKGRREVEMNAGDERDVEREVLDILRDVVSETNRTAEGVSVATPSSSSPRTPRADFPLVVKTSSEREASTAARETLESGRGTNASRAATTWHISRRSISHRTLAAAAIAVFAFVCALLNMRWASPSNSGRVSSAADAAPCPRCPEPLAPPAPCARTNERAQPTIDIALETEFEPIWRAAIEDARVTHDKLEPSSERAKTLRALAKRARDAHRALKALNADAERFALQLYSSSSALDDGGEETHRSGAAFAPTRSPSRAAAFDVKRARARVDAIDAFDALRASLNAWM